MSNNQKYTADNIRSLKIFPDALREKPAVYLDAIGLNAVMKMFNEAIANSLDEFNAGVCKNITVIIDPKENPTFTVIDDGRGIPHEKLKDILTRIYTSGKYDNNAYGTSIGTNGIGTKILVACSTDFYCETWRDGKKSSFKSFKGSDHEMGESIYKGGDTGTKMTFNPDLSVLLQVDIRNQKETYFNFLEILSYVNHGVRINVHWGSEKRSFYHPNGLIDYFEMIKKKRKLKVLGGEPIHIRHEDGKKGLALDIVFGFASNISREISKSYINGHQTAEGGVHMTGLRKGLGVFTREINKGTYVPKSATYKVQGDDVRDLLVAIVTATHPKPIYSNQTKSSFVSLDYDPYITGVLNEEIPKWISSHPDQFDEIAKMVAKVARAKYEARKAKGEVLKTASVKSNTLGLVDPRKFTDCNGNNSEENELFIVEGNSAGGSASSARDKEHQAVYRLRGKIKNPMKSPVLSEEAQNIMKIINCGIGSTKDISKLRYKRIIFACDADVDGEHIASILSGLFFKYLPELIVNGNVYVAKPPLYMMKLKNEKVYLHNMDQYNRFIIENAIQSFEILDNKGNPFPDEMARCYFQSIMDYGTLVEEMAIQMGVDNTLMELLVLYFSKIMNNEGNEYLKRYGYEISEFTKVEDWGEYRLAIDHGYQHYHIKINKDVYNNYILPIHDYLKSEVKIANVIIRGKRSGIKYTNLTYGHYLLMRGSIEDGNVKIQRFKGLGEMNPEQLWETTMDPETRHLVQLTMDDFDHTEHWMKLLLSDNSAEKKELFTF